MIIKLIKMLPCLPHIQQNLQLEVQEDKNGGFNRAKTSRREK